MFFAGPWVSAHGICFLLAVEYRSRGRKNVVSYPNSQFLRDPGSRIGIACASIASYRKQSAFALHTQALAIAHALCVRIYACVSMRKRSESHAQACVCYAFVCEFECACDTHTLARLVLAYANA